MAKFYYQIKGKGADGNWDWPPIASGKVEAVDRKEARKKLEEEYGMKIPGGRLKNLADQQQMLMSIEVMTSYLERRFEEKECKNCSQVFTLNEKYLINAGGQQDFCSSGCTQDFANKIGVERNVNFDFHGIHEPVIYKITNKKTGLCYIGKTTQAFTLRWYQHFYQGCGTKFHEAIKEYGIDNWTFEVIEIVSCSQNEQNKMMLERESFWIKHFDCIKNGYNSVISKKEIEESNQIKFEL